MSHDMLSAFGATPVAERVVIDANVITGGGVTAGIDFALRVAAETFGEDVAKSIQLMLEYHPKPPFDAGTPHRAGPDLVAKARERASKWQEDRQARVAAGTEALAGPWGRPESFRIEVAAAEGLRCTRAGAAILGVLHRECAAQ